MTTLIAALLVFVIWGLAHIYKQLQEISDKLPKRDEP